MNYHTTEPTTLTDLIAGALLVLLFWIWASLFIIAFTPADEDYTDTGVQCVDDCLEPLEK